MPSIDPKTSFWLNVGLGLLIAVLTYIAKEGLPPPWPDAWSVIAKAQSAWLGGLLAVGVAALNGYLHAVSADAPGPLAK